MNIIKSSVEILGQEPGIIGMKKLIERCARTSYKSEDRITEDSYIKFLNMLRERGHWACFEFGTVYLKITNLFDDNTTLARLDSLLSSKHSRYETVGDDIYITTNYRLILQNNLEDLLEKYWIEPTEYHYRRVATHWVCSRSTSHQLVRHRNFSYIQESQRYINYSKDKFGNEITYILPQWIMMLEKILEIL